MDYLADLDNNLNVISCLDNISFKFMSPTSL